MWQCIKKYFLLVLNDREDDIFNVFVLVQLVYDGVVKGYGMLVGVDCVFFYFIVNMLFSIGF